MTAARLSGAAMLAALALAGCATGKLRPADTRLPTAYEAPVPAPGSAADMGLDRWWRLYDDPQLTELVEQALAASPDAKDAAAKLQAARAVRAQALSAYGPQGKISGAFTHEQLGLLESEQDFLKAYEGSLGGSTGLGATGGAGAGFTTLGASDSGQAAFSVSWEADLFGRRASARKAADADLRAAEFTAAATRWSLSAEVASDLFQARGLALQLTEAKDTLNDEQRLLEIAKAKVAHGLTPSSDEAQTRSDYLSAQAQADSLDAQLTAARRSLLLLVGRGVDPLASLPMPATVGAPPAMPAAVPGALLVRRPDVLVAREQVQAASGQLSLDEKALLPTIDLEPGIGLLQETASAASRLGFWSIGVGVSQPVLDIPRLMAQTRQQKAVGERAVIAYEKAVQTAYGDAENAFVYFASDSRRLEMLKGAEQAADFAYQAKLTGYRRGLNDLQTTLTAEAAWRQARVARAGAETTLMQRSVQVFKALGGGWPAPGQASATPSKSTAAG
ncbi:MAG TPA: TolC family protein [Caulobacteraceae bacterium]|nr:TolC family protein [Caulobacteraceae bacterium]